MSGFCEILPDGCLVMDMRSVGSSQELPAEHVWAAPKLKQTEELLALN